VRVDETTHRRCLRELFIEKILIETMVSPYVISQEVRGTEANDMRATNEIRPTKRQEENRPKRKPHFNQNKNKKTNERHKEKRRISNKKRSKVCKIKESGGKERTREPENQTKVECREASETK
jgi:hypothetical protein